MPAIAGRCAGGAHPRPSPNYNVLETQKGQPDCGRPYRVLAGVADYSTAPSGFCIRNQVRLPM
jgi:hypothetical protein